MFTEKQLEVIRDLAGCYWDNNIRPIYPEEGSFEGFRKLYIQGIIDGLTDPEVWG